MNPTDALTGNTDHAQAASTSVATDENTDRVFEDAVAPLVPLLLRYFARRVAPTDDAADCTSETLHALWRHRSRLPTTDNERRAWAYGIARKVLANHNRGRIRRATANQALRDAAAIPAAPIPDEAFTAAEALKLLSPRDQELVRLIVWEELSVADAGRALGIRPGTARTRYSRALSRLRTTYALLDRA